MSRDNHVIFPQYSLAQALANVVLPNPAGAEINDNLNSIDSSNLRNKRSRFTIKGLHSGTNSFVLIR